MQPSLKAVNSGKLWAQPSAVTTIKTHETASDAADDSQGFHMTRVKRKDEGHDSSTAPSLQVPWLFFVNKRLRLQCMMQN